MTPTLRPTPFAVRLALAGLLVPAAAFAQSSNVVQQLPANTVTATATDDPTTEHSQSYNASRTTIGKGVQDVKDIPQSVTTVTRQQMNDQNLRTLGEALEQSAGVLVQDSNNFQRSYYSRGFEIDTISYDGVSMQGASQNGFLVQPDLAMYDRVEVLRGPSGLMTGNGSPGGVINLVRKRALADKQINATLSGGSWNNYYGDVDVTGKLNESGSLRGRVVGSYTNREYFFDEADTRRSLLYGTLEYDIAPSTTVSVGVSHEHHNMQPYYGGLPRWSDGRDLGLPRDTYLNANWSRTIVDRDGLYGDITHRFARDWSAKVTTSYLREKNHDRSGSNFGAVNTATGMGPSLSAFDGRLDGEQIGVDATLNGSFEAFGRKHDVLVGANYYDREYDYYNQLMHIASPAIDVFDFDPADYGVFPTQPSPTRAATNTKAKMEQYGVYGAMGFSITEPLKLILGGRVSHYETENRNNLTGRVTARTKDAGVFTPYGGLTYALTPQWTAYASYAEIFTSQANRYDRNGEALDPMTGDNYELGLKGALMGGRVNAAFAIFRINQENRAIGDAGTPNPCPASPVGGACYVADGKVRSQGVDAQLSGAVLPGWQVAAGYTFNTTKYLTDRTTAGAPSPNEGAPFSTFTPKHIVRLWTNYQLPENLSAWSVGGGVNFLSSAYKTSGTLRIEQGAYAVWNARVGYQINRNLDASLNINNLFDKTYYRTLGTTTGGNWYGEPRNVMLTLRASY